MSNGNAPQVPGRIAGAVAGASGEGADSALKAMLQKRRLGIDPSADLAAPIPSPRPGIPQSGRKGGK